jgi:hypothetical protein
VGEYDQVGCQEKILQWRKKENGLGSCALVKGVGGEGIGLIRNFGRSTGQKKRCHVTIPQRIFVTSTVLKQQGVHTAKTKQQ